MKRLRVLAIAESANPEWVSVPLVGWSHVRALAQVADVHLVTQQRNREAIERAGLRLGEDFTSIDSEAVARVLWQIGNLLRGGAGRGFTLVTALGGFAYYYFEHLVWKEFGAAIQAGEYDVVHRITPLSPTVPSLLAKRCARAGVPFVLGPLNGGVPWPKGFDRARRQEFEWLSYVRDAYRLLPGYRSTRSHAAAIVIGSQATWEQMPERYRERCVYVPENAIEPERLPTTSEDGRRPQAEPLEKRGPLRVAFLGRLVPYKGPDMLLEAMLPMLRSGHAKLEVIGDGPLRASLEATIEREKVAPNVQLHGWLEHEAALRTLQAADVLGLPSIREFGGGVVLEAMAVGVVPVVVNYGGPAELVTPTTGLAIPLGTRAQIVERFRACLQSLAENPMPLEDLAVHGRERITSHFTWPAKAQQMLRIYAWVLGREPKPNFGMPIGEYTQGL